MLEHATTFASLVELFALWSERRTADAAPSTGDFVAWLREQALPDLLQLAESSGAALISMKAHQHERFERVEQLLKEIRALVAPAGEWEQLEETDRLVLSALFAALSANEAREPSFEELRAATKLPADALRRSARYLDERGLAHVREYAGGLEGFLVGLRDAGVLLAWESTDPTEFERSRRALIAALPGRSETARLGSIAATADTPVWLAAVQIGTWASQGLLRLDRTYPPGMSTVYGVSASLQRTTK